jgi:hypothetical protein
MVVRIDDLSAGSPRIPACATCGALLALDQRYCLECGTRRGPLPPRVAELIDAIAEQPARGVPAGADHEVPSDGLSRGFAFTMPSPRAAAVAVMSTLAFGTVVGSGAESLATSPITLNVSAPPPTPPVAAPTAASVDTSSVSADSTAVAPAATPVVQQQAVTVTTPAPATSSTGVSPTGVVPGLPPVKHVFLIMLSEQGESQSFGVASHAAYLSKTLRKQGELVPNYYAVAQGPLANGIALISGQGPTPQTVAGCPLFSVLAPAGKGASGQVLGTGCVYPKRTQTIADQLTAAGHTWRAYVEGLGKKTHGQAATCRRPAIGAKDGDQTPTRSDPYVTWRNPFVYFQSLTAATGCVKNDLGLGQLSTDLKAAATTPSLSYIVPGACDDGSDQPCAPHAPAGLAPAEKFLRSVVPKIESSAGYKDGGLIAITFDEAPQTGVHADPSSCCNNPTPYPNLPATPAATTPGTTTTTTTTTPGTGVTTTPGAAPYGIAPVTTTPTATTPTTTTTTPTTTTPTTTTPATGLIGGETSPTGGGGQVGLLLISSYVKPGSTDLIDYFNHYSLLSTVEGLFGLKHLGYALDPALPAFGKAAFNAYTGG